ncbi:MAG: hypothetical protein P4L56_17590 [Candidatus Sulfopaludibacter sp.]|nr:hypothetical protein [Candidatus Sulfopaludibacter sp.]
MPSPPNYPILEEDAAPQTEVVYSTSHFDLLAKTMKPGEEPYDSLRVPRRSRLDAAVQTRPSGVWGT